MADQPFTPDPEHERALRRYWRDTRVILAFLFVWFLVSCVLGSLLVEPLNRCFLGGFPLGFWIARQGAIYVFILLVLAYCLLMEYGDRKFHVREEKRRAGKQ